MGFNRFIFTLVLVSSMVLNQQEGALNNLDRNPTEEVIEVEEPVEEPVEDEVMEEEVEEQEEVKEEVVKFKVEGLNLREGITNEEVLRIKRFFIGKGYGNIVENFYFDSRLKEVVVEYQKNNGLDSDGIIGKNTYEVINKDMELNNIIIPEVEVIFLNATNPKELIIINKDNNTLYHIMEEKVLKRYPIATGKTPAYTPEGKFTIVNKLIDPAWGGAGRHTPVKGGAPNNPLGRRWMGLSIGGGGVYGIHGNSDKGSIGKYISLGCVRMLNEDVEYLYDLIAKGTPVWIGSGAKLKEYGIIYR